MCQCHLYTYIYIYMCVCGDVCCLKFMGVPSKKKTWKTIAPTINKSKSHIGCSCNDFAMGGSGELHSGRL